jgi:hypothetical protein
MSDKKEIAVPDGNNLPAHIAALGVDESYLSQLQKYIIPPMVKIIQKMSDIPGFTAGDVIISPQMIQLPTNFFFTPLVFYPEYLEKNPNGVNPFIIDRSLDPEGELAIKSKDKKTWEYECPSDPKKMCKIDEHLCFVVMIEGDHPLADTPIVMSFAVGEHKTGRKFLNQLQVRRAGQPYANRFEATLAQRKEKEGQPWGFDITNPSDGEAWTSAEVMPRYIKLAESMQAYIQQGVLRTDHEDPSSDEKPVETSEY